MSLLEELKVNVGLYSQTPSGNWLNEFAQVDVPVFTVNQSAGTTETKTVKYYVFEEILTTGLTYGYGFTPEVGKIYDSEVMVKINLY